MPADLQHLELMTNGVKLHAVAAGPDDGPLVLLLHGFPEGWLGFRKQIGPLAEEGFRVVAPDQRGYGRSDKPAAVSAYALDTLAQDVVGLIEALDRREAHVVGHDWGGAVAWWTAIRHPQQVLRLGILNVPHPQVMARHLLRHPRQLARSWYMLFFQLPQLPELLTGLGDGEGLARALTRSARHGTFNPEELAAYREAWANPGARRGMINWYRAAFRDLRRTGGRVHGPTETGVDPRRVTVPTLLVWGAKDVFLGRDMAKPSINLCDDGRLVFIEEASHWVQHEEPERVNTVLLEFLRSADVSR